MPLSGKPLSETRRTDAHAGSDTHLIESGPRRRGRRGGMAVTDRPVQAD